MRSQGGQPAPEQCGYDITPTGAVQHSTLHDSTSLVQHSTINTGPKNQSSTVQQSKSQYIPLPRSTAE